MKNKIFTTKKGFGGLLRAGLNCEIIAQNGENITIKVGSNIYHGKINEIE